MTRKLAGIGLVCGLMLVGVLVGTNVLVRADPASQNTPSEACLLCTFDFDRSRHVIALPKKFREASGLAITEGGQAVVHDDERASLLFFDPFTGEITERVKIMQDDKVLRGDFEGVALGPSHLYLVTSQAELIVRRDGEASEDATHETFDTGVADQYEIEGLTHHSAHQSLILAVKTIYDSEDERGLALLEWSIKERRLLAQGLSVAKSVLSERVGTPVVHPSGVTFDEVSGHYLLVASAERLLLELSGKGRVVAVVKLKKKHHRQPEGLALMQSDGEHFLLIADEGGKSGGGVTVYGEKID